MSKISPSVIRRKLKVTKTFEISDPENPEVAFSLFLRRLSVMESAAAYELGAEKVVQYVTGSGEPGSRNYEPPEPFPGICEETVILTKGTCALIAMVFYAQDGPEEDRYTFEELAAFATSDAVSIKLVEASEWAEPKEKPVSDDPNRSTPTSG